MPFLKGESPPHPPVFSEKASSKGWPHKAMIKWPHKLIWNLATNRFLLYNLEEDPKERKNLTLKEPERFEQLKSEFQLSRATTLREIPARKGKR